MQRLKKLGIEAVGVCFLWSVLLNPDNELAMGRVLDEHLPNVPVTLSHQLLPIVREYRRASATVIDASLKPLMQKHLREMESDLRASGFHGETLVSTSMGGCMHVEELIERPIHLVKSGPAMAPVAAKTYARRSGKIRCRCHLSAILAVQPLMSVLFGAVTRSSPAKAGSAANGLDISSACRV